MDGVWNGCCVEWLNWGVAGVTDWGVFGVVWSDCSHVTGTKWCGPGSIARSYEDLGVLSKVDRCCREHDNCPVSLSAGQCNKNGICNNSPFTR